MFKRWPVSSLGERFNISREFPSRNMQRNAVNTQQPPRVTANIFSTTTTFYESPPFRRNSSIKEHFLVHLYEYTKQ